MKLAQLEIARRRRRMVVRLLGGLLIVALMAVVPADRFSNVASAQGPGPNPIVVENQQPGSNPWFWSKLGDDVAKQIKGYASATSVSQGESLTFHVTVNPVQTYTIDFYRVGWYGGLGGRHRLHVGPLSGVQQPACPTDPSTGLIACAWTPSYTLFVPADWTSGVYLGLLTNEQGFQNYMIFVVKDGRPAPFLYQESITTEQAYSNYPNDGVTGKSLYAYSSYGANTVSGNPSAVKVSFDRPLADGGFGSGFIRWEINAIAWLERSGYDVTYSTDLDTHVNGGELLNHKAFLSVGHDEYWSKEMRDAAEWARDAGVNLAFFGANAAYTQVRFEPAASGEANRVMVCYRSEPWNQIDPVHGPTTTTNFRSPLLNRPEQSLVGVMYSTTLPNTDYVVRNSSHWVYAGTGFMDGDTVRGIVGYEADSLLSNYPAPYSANQTLLSQSPAPSGGPVPYLHSSIYQAPSGAWVFASGTMSWSWALADPPGPYAQFLVDARIQRTTANVLNAFLNGPPPTIVSIAPTTGAIGSSMTINGTSFTSTGAVTFNGTAATFTVMSDGTIQATVPTGATTGPVSVTTAGGTAISATSFIVIPPPTIASFAPASGPVGTIVTISGANFSGASAVTFNGRAASFTVTSDSAIQATVPTGATTGPVRVTTPGGTATTAGNFTVTAALTVRKMSTLGLGGGTVTSSPAGINCGSTCSANYSVGAAPTVVTLTATPNLLSTFNGWSGCDTASGTTCTVTMSGAKTVVANFFP